MPLFYVKKWAKSEEAILFRLSNKIVQVNFNDKTQLVLYCDRDLLLYAGHNGKDKQVMSMSSGEYKKNHELMSRYV